MRRGTTMNKQCTTCGALVPNEANFCQACGNTQFIIIDYDPYNTEYDQYNQQTYANQAWQPPVSNVQPKKKKTGLIIGIVAAVLIVLATIGGIAEKTFQEQGYGNNDSNIIDNSNSDNESEKLDYSKGNFDGSVYTNKWADIELALPEGYSNADLATYSAAENLSTECGLYFVADDTMSLIYICYEKLPSYPDYDEEEYLDIATKNMQNVEGITYQIPDTYDSVKIAGNTYVRAVCQFNNGYGDFVQTIYVRKLDNYMILISTGGVDAASNDALAGKITAAE